MFYGRRNIVALSLIFVLSICLSVFCFNTDTKEVVAADEGNGVYSLSDFEKLSDNLVLTGTDKYATDTTLNNNTKLGNVPAVNNSVTFEFEVNYADLGGNFTVVFTKKTNIDKNVAFQISFSTPNKVKIGNISSGVFSVGSGKQQNIAELFDNCVSKSFICSCMVSANSSSITLTSGKSIELTANMGLGNIDNCDVYLCHSSNNFKDLTLREPYCKITTVVLSADGTTIGGETIKIAKGHKLDKDELKTPESYTINGEIYEFDYWSVDGEKYDFNKPVNSAFTLVAQYKKASQIKGSITVVDSDGNTLQSFYENEIYGIDSKFDKSKVETTIYKLKGFTYNGSLYCKLSDIPFENNDIQVTAEVITVYMEDGASVRLAEPAGIRFSGGNSIDCVEYGMFLTAKDYLSDNENNMTVDYLKENNLTYSIITSLNDIQQSVNGGIAEYAIVLKDIKTENYGVDFVARSFVKVKYYDNTECYIYSDFSFNNNSRSIYNVANKAISDFGGSNEVLQKYIDGVIELKEINGEIIFVANNYKNYKVEIQKEENSVLITVIPNDGIESLVIGSIIFNGKLKKIDVSSSNQYRISY